MLVCVKSKQSGLTHSAKISIYVTWPPQLAHCGVQGRGQQWLRNISRPQFPTNVSDKCSISCRPPVGWHTPCCLACHHTKHGAVKLFTCRQQCGDVLVVTSVMSLPTPATPSSTHQLVSDGRVLSCSNTIFSDLQYSASRHHVSRGLLKLLVSNCQSHSSLQCYIYHPMFQSVTMSGH